MYACPTASYPARAASELISAAEESTSTGDLQLGARRSTSARRRSCARCCCRTAPGPGGSSTGGGESDCTGQLWSSSIEGTRWECLGNRLAAAAAQGERALAERPAALSSNTNGYTTPASHAARPTQRVASGQATSAGTRCGPQSVCIIAALPCLQFQEPQFATLHAAEGQGAAL